MGFSGHAPLLSRIHLCCDAFHGPRCSTKKMATGWGHWGQSLDRGMHSTTSYSKSVLLTLLRSSRVQGNDPERTY